MRVLKFRAWGPNLNHMWPWEELQDCAAFRLFGEGQGEKIVMQFTGLRDKNGKEIYEGDVVRLSFGIPPTSICAVIEYRDNEYLGEVGCAVSGWWMDGIGGAHSAPVHTCYEHDIEVVGNIYEHPEMLKAV